MTDIEEVRKDLLRQIRDVIGDTSREATEIMLRIEQALKTIVPVVEYGVLYSGGDYLIRSHEEWIERIYPLADYIEHGLRNGGKVGKRTIVILEDWELITGS